MKKLIGSNKGQGMTEYILIIALIALFVIGGVKFFGKKVKAGFNDAADQIESSVNEGIEKGKHANGGG
ncbi:MAG: hypothetical protein JXR81_00415 [Candidatus Goldbacteria bacterium]|nr:hypothetical protein [Candidatus Goldiibacteriota bacterium]